MPTFVRSVYYVGSQNNADGRRGRGRGLTTPCNDHWSVPLCGKTKPPPLSPLHMPIPFCQPAQNVLNVTYFRKSARCRCRHFLCFQSLAMKWFAADHWSDYFPSHPFPWHNQHCAPINVTLYRRQQIVTKLNGPIDVQQCNVRSVIAKFIQIQRMHNSFHIKILAMRIGVWHIV